MTSQEEKILKELDALLIEIQKKLNINKILSPTNMEQEHKIFLQKKGKYNPIFTYDFPKIEEINSILKLIKDTKNTYFKSKKYKNPISKLLHEKLQEQENKANLVIAYIKKDFKNIEKYNTILFGSFDKNLIKKAEKVLSNYQEPPREIRGKKLNNQEILRYISSYLKKENITDIKVKRVKFATSKFTLALTETGCSLVFSENFTTREHELLANLMHEIQGHYKRYINGKKTGRKILTYGTANNTTDEEGFATYLSHKYLKQFAPDFKKKSMYEKYLILAKNQGKSFEEIAEFVQKINPENNLTKTFKIVTRVKQGIQDTGIKKKGNLFLRNKAYGEGIEKIENRIKKGGQEGGLLIGKIKIEDLKYIIDKG